MKDSGIEWIGKIPKQWKTIKCKYLMDIYSGELISKSDLTDKKLFPVFGGGKQIGYYNKYNVVEGTIVVGRVGALCGCVTFMESKAWATDNALIVNCKKGNNKFWAYNLYSAELNRLNNSNAQPLITANKILNLSITMPSEIIQNKIADFLDKKCNEIDKLKTDIKKQIAILDDYKKSLIFKSLSQGIHDSILQETSSEIWRKIPKHWQLCDIKYLFEIIKRIAGKEGYNVLSVTQKGLKIKDLKSNEGQLAENYSGYQFVYPTDYVMNHMDLLTGWVDCSKVFGVTSPDYRVFRLRDKKKNDLNYFKYVMQCCYICKIFYSLGQGVSNLGRWRLQTSVFMNFKIPLPPPKEQKEIADFLDDKCTKIDEIIELKRKQIAKIDEYKKSLIYEYVTGKKEVY